MLTKREFYEPEFYAYCAQQYEIARVYLKNCGKPKDAYDIFLAKEAKETSSLFKRMISD